MKTPAARHTRTLVFGSAVATVTLATGLAQDEGLADGLSALQRGTMTAAYTTSRDVGSRLYRNRAGIRPGSHLPPAPAPVSDSKGGMASSKDAKVAAVIAPEPNRWEVFGSLFFYSEDHDDSALCGTCGTLLDTDTTLESVGGTVGVEYHLDSNWSIGLGVGAASSELEMGYLGTDDIDSLAISPYVSYYQADALGSADFWASAMYSYGMHSHDIIRYTGAGYALASPDADTHLLEFVTGLNFGEEDFVHGPYAGLRWITGDIDAYTEVGPGGVFIPGQDLDSLVSILGYQASWHIGQGNGYWVPQLRLAWEHEFENGNSVLGLPVSEGDEDFGVVGVGIGYWWKNGWHAGLDYEGRFGSDTESHYAGLNGGKEF